MAARCRGQAGVVVTGVGLRARAKALGDPPDPKATAGSLAMQGTAVGTIWVASKPGGLNISE
jgi:hypothetical protein